MSAAALAPAGAVDAAALTLRGNVASYRDSWSQVGIQETFPVPPPATVWGMLRAMRRDLPPGLSASITLAHVGVFEDYEHTHRLTAKKAELSPTRRQALGLPVLDLVLFDPQGRVSAAELVEWARFPEWPMTLGRSQDLSTVVSADVVTLTPRLSGRVRAGTVLTGQVAQRAPMSDPRGLPMYISDLDRTDVRVRRCFVPRADLHVGPDMDGRPDGLSVDEPLLGTDAWLCPVVTLGTPP